jgi:hypothetical protein
VVSLVIFLVILVKEMVNNKYQGQYVLKEELDAREIKIELSFCNSTS